MLICVLGFQTDRMLLLWGFALLLFADISYGQTTYLDFSAGERASFRCDSFYSNGDVYITDAAGDVLYSYENFRAVVTYPDRYETNTTNARYHYLTIKKVELEDAMTYTCYRYSTVYGIFIVDVFVTDNSDLTNKVIESGGTLRLAYYTEMADQTSVQWTFQQQSGSKGDIYYANAQDGGILPSGYGYFRESSTGYGVFERPMSTSVTGKYQYFVSNPPNLEQKVFEVAQTNDFRCSPAPYVINGTQHYHTCRSEVSRGNIVPEFTWFRNGVIMEGTLSSYNTSATTVYTYMQTFRGSFDDEGADYTCLMKFRYNGGESDSEFIDTSDPEYSSSCEVNYWEIEYGVYEVYIYPDSEDGPLILRVGQQLRCDGNGTGTVSYSWYCSGMPDPVVGQFLEISEIFFWQKCTSCECRASNRLSDGSYHNITTEIEFEIAHKSDILTQPEPVIFQPVGESLQLDCTLAPFINSTESSGTWRYQWTVELRDDEDFIKHLIYSGSGDNYKVLDIWADNFEAGGSKHDLVMKSANFELAGVYKCEPIQYPILDTMYSFVYVIDAVKCNLPKRKIKRGEKVEMTCQVEHSGSIEPEMIWYAGDRAVSVPESAKTMRRDFSSVKQIAVEVEASPGITYKCGATFKSGTSTYTDECTAVIEFDEEDGKKSSKLRK